MILLVIKIVVLLSLLSLYGINIIGSDNPLFAFFYQPNFIMLLIILFIISTFFKIIRVLFTLMLIGGIAYYGYSYYIGESPLNKYALKMQGTQEQIGGKCGENASWFDKMTGHCYTVQMEKQINE